MIAIVDSGIDLSHSDLSSKVLSGRTFLDCGAQGCGNGDWQSGPRAQRDGESHGTRVAGIAGAATGNGRGVAGVAPGVKLLAVRMLGHDGSGLLRRRRARDPRLRRPRRRRDQPEPRLAAGGRRPSRSSARRRRSAAPSPTRIGGAR